MPFKSQKKKLQHSAEWRKKHHSPEYMRWLYQRRMIPKNQMRVLRETLERFGSGEQLTHQQIQTIALSALEWCDEIEKDVGNRFNHETQTPYWVEPTVRSPVNTTEPVEIKR